MLNWLANLAMMDTLIAIISFIVALVILIAVHEWGHFWVARRCGVKVLRFSIGFGKRLYRWTDKTGTEFVIAAIPLGGYVKMLDERVEEVTPELRGQAFNNKTIGQRAAIVSAGPIANFVLAFLFYWLISMIGQSVLRPVVGAVIPNSIAAHAGILPDEELKSLAGIETKSWYDVSLALMDTNQQANVDVELASLDTESMQTRQLNFSNWHLATNENPLKALGIIPMMPTFDLQIKSVTPDSAAARAMLEPGDQIVAVDDEKVLVVQEFIRQVQASPDEPLQLKIKRNGEIKTITLTPDKIVLDDGKEQGFAGFKLEVANVKPLADKYITTVQYGPIDSIYQAGKQVWRITSLITKEVGRLISGNRELSSLSGPVTMAKGAGRSAEGGFVSYLGFLAIISLNLGIINLLPLPVLDGGHLLFLLIEKVTGRPISERVQNYCYRIGIVILMTLMGLVFFNDFSNP